MTYLSYKIVSVQDPLWALGIPYLTDGGDHSQKPMAPSYADMAHQKPGSHPQSLTSTAEFPPLGSATSPASAAGPRAALEGSNALLPPPPQQSGAQAPQRDLSRLKQQSKDIEDMLKKLHSDLHRWSHNLSKKIDSRKALDAAELEVDLAYAMDRLEAIVPKNYHGLETHLPNLACKSYQVVISKVSFCIFKVNKDVVISGNRHEITKFFSTARDVLCQDLVFHAYQILGIDRSELHTIDDIKRRFRDTVETPFDPRKGVRPDLKALHFLYHAFNHTTWPNIFLADSPSSELPSLNTIAVVLVERLFDIMCRIPTQSFDSFFEKFLHHKRFNTNPTPFVTLVEDIKTAYADAFSTRTRLNLTVSNLNDKLQKGAWLTHDELRELLAHLNQTYCAVVLQEAPDALETAPPEAQAGHTQLDYVVGTPKKHHAEAAKTKTDQTLEPRCTPALFDWKEAVDTEMAKDNERTEMFRKAPNTSKSARASAAAAAPESPKERVTTPSDVLKRYIETSALIKGHWAIQTIPVTEILKNLQCKPFLNNIDPKKLHEEFKGLTTVRERTKKAIRRQKGSTVVNYKFNVFGYSIPYSTIVAILKCIEDVLGKKTQDPNDKKAKANRRYR